MIKEQRKMVVKKCLDNSPTGWKIFSALKIERLTFLLKSSMLYNSAELFSTFSVQNIIKIHSTVFNSCFRDHFPCYGIGVSCSNTHEPQFSRSTYMKRTAVAKRQSRAHTDTSLIACKQLCQMDITISSN